MSDDGRNLADEAEPSSYRSKPPLWQPKPEKPPSLPFRLVLGVAAGLVAFGGLILLLEPTFLSVPEGQVEVTVVGVQAGRPADELPAAYRHEVQLHDGRRTSFVSRELHRQGERLVVTVARGRITGRLWLSSPYGVTSGSAGQGR